MENFPGQGPPCQSGNWGSVDCFQKSKTFQHSLWFLFLSLGIFYIWWLLWKKIKNFRLHQVNPKEMQQHVKDTPAKLLNHQHFFRCMLNIHQQYQQYFLGELVNSLDRTTPHGGLQFSKKNLKNYIFSWNHNWQWNEPEFVDSTK